MCAVDLQVFDKILRCVFCIHNRITRISVSVYNCMLQYEYGARMHVCHFFEHVLGKVCTCAQKRKKARTCGHQNIRYHILLDTHTEVQASSSVLLLPA
jgi:hypothetical protein